MRARAAYGPRRAAYALLGAALLLGPSCAHNAREYRHIGAPLGYAHPYAIAKADSMGLALLTDERGDTLLLWVQHCGPELCYVPSAAAAADSLVSCHPQGLPERHRARHLFAEHAGVVWVAGRRDRVWFWPGRRERGSGHENRSP